MNGFVMTKDKTFELTINNLLLVSDTLKFEWTDLLKYTFEQLLSSEIYSTDFNQKDFATSLGISQSSLSKHLNKGNIKIYLHTRNTMGYLLEEFDESVKNKRILKICVWYLFFSWNCPDYHRFCFPKTNCRSI